MERKCQSCSAEERSASRAEQRFPISRRPRTKAALYLLAPEAPGEAVDVLNQRQAATMDWMKANKLKLNPDKTEMLLVGASSDQMEGIQPVLDGAPLPLKKQFHSLGVLLEPSLALEAQMASKIQSAFYQLQLPRKRRGTGSESTASPTLVLASEMPLSCVRMAAALSQTTRKHRRTAEQKELHQLISKEEKRSGFVEVEGPPDIKQILVVDGFRVMFNIVDTSSSRGSPSTMECYPPGDKAQGPNIWVNISPSPVRRDCGNAWHLFQAFYHFSGHVVAGSAASLQLPHINWVNLSPPKKQGVPIISWKSPRLAGPSSKVWLELISLVLPGLLPEDLAVNTGLQEMSLSKHRRQREWLLNGGGLLLQAVHFLKTIAEGGKGGKKEKMVERGMSKSGASTRSNGYETWKLPRISQNLQDSPLSDMSFPL
ncbi:Phosphate acyltransferase [Varanus komodoensis]|nr:Phosphate acyltransferase [Varanus komodoensis]